jgi:phospholipase/lecithinase/hemolysin
VANLPALGDKPDYVDTPNQAFANNIVTTYNPKLAQTLVDLKGQLPGLKLTAWDVYTDFNQLLQNPASFGFTNVKDSAYSSSGPYPGTVVANPNQHLFWDHTHPTQPGHVLLGRYAYAVLIPEPATLVLLSMGIAPVFTRRRFVDVPRQRC